MTEYVVVAHERPSRQSRRSIKIDTRFATLRGALFVLARQVYAEWGPGYEPVRIIGVGREGTRMALHLEVESEFAAEMRRATPSPH